MLEAAGQKKFRFLNIGIHGSLLCSLVLLCSYFVLIVWHFVTFFLKFWNYLVAFWCFFVSYMFGIRFIFFTVSSLEGGGLYFSVVFP